jgi:hypothetical protein
VRREPIAPTYATSAFRSATSSSGTSNLGSWVSTHSTVRRSTRPPAISSSRYRCGHFTTTSSAEGNREWVANTGRASHTVTRYPRKLPIRATAAAKSIAPNTSIRGAGANDHTNTRMPSPRRSPSGP